MVVAFERLKEQEVDREPDRSAPVGVAAKESGRGFSRLIIDAILATAGVKDRGMLLVEFRNRSQTVRRKELIFIEHISQNTFELVAGRDGEENEVVTGAQG